MSSVTYSPRQKKRLHIVVLHYHKHKCLLVLFILVDVFSLTNYYRFYVGRPVVKSLLVQFMLVDAFSLTSYYRLYVGRPVVKSLLVQFMLVDAFSLNIYYRLYVGHPVVLYSTIK